MGTIKNGKINGGSSEDRVMARILQRSTGLFGVDLLWLLLVRCTAFNPVCTSTYTFDKEIEPDDLRDALERQCRLFPKYRQRIAWHGLSKAPTYEDDPHFSIDRHFTVVRLPEPAGPEELDDFVSKVISRRWDEKLPLWEAILLPNYRNGRAKAAMVSRGHHTQADGQGFILSALYITSYGEHLQKVMDDGVEKRHKARLGQLCPSEISPFLRHLNWAFEQRWLKPFVQLFLFSLYWLAAFEECIERSFWSIVHFFYTLAFFVATAWRIEMVVPVKSGPREAVWALSKPVELSDVKTIQHAFSGDRPGRNVKGDLGHVTVNDVLCSIMADVIAAAIKRNPPRGVWANLKAGCGKVLPVPIAMFIPISVRAPGQWDMRNLSTAAIAYLGYCRQSKPTAKQIHKHIHKSKRSLNVIKKSYLPAIVFHLCQLAGNVPWIFYPILGRGLPQAWPIRELRQFVAARLISIMTVVLTNIPGPPEAAVLAGGKILRWSAAPPQAGRGVLAIGVITYDASVAVTASVDKVFGFEDAAQRICADFETRFKHYLQMAEEALDNN